MGSVIWAVDGIAPSGPERRRLEGAVIHHIPLSPAEDQRANEIAMQFVSEWRDAKYSYLFSDCWDYSAMLYRRLEDAFPNNIPWKGFPSRRVK